MIHLVRESVDSIDLEILKFLQENARAQCNEMSKRVGVSDRTVARRIKRMEEKGIIKGYKIELSEEVVEKFFPSHKMPLEHTVEMPAVCWDSIIDVIVGTFGVGGVLIIYNIGLSIGRTYGTLLKRFSDEREILLSNFCNLFKSNGWGEISLIKVDYETGYGLINVSRFPFKSTLSENLIRGIIAGFLEKMYERKFTVKKLESEAEVKDIRKLVLEVGCK